MGGQSRRWGSTTRPSGGRGKVWTGGGEGLFHFSGVAWRQVEIESELPDNEVFDVEITESGVWAGTGRGVARFDGSTWQHFGLLEGLPGDMVLSLSVAPDGTLWAGTSNGAAVFNGVTWSAVDGLQNVRIDEIAFASDGTAWASTFGDGVAAWQNGDVEWFRAADALLSDETYTVHVAPNGIVWVGTSIGLNSYDGVQWKSYGSGSGLPYPAIKSVTSDKDGDLWVGTQKGVGRYNGRTWTSYYKSDGLASNLIYEVLAREVDMWFATGGGITVRRPDNCWSSWTSQHGIPDDQINNVVFGVDNAVWLATHAGLVKGYFREASPSNELFLPFSTTRVRQ